LKKTGKFDLSLMTEMEMLLKLTRFDRN